MLLLSTKYNYLTIGLARALLSRSMKTSKVTLIIVIVCVIKLSIYNIEKGLEDNEFVKAHTAFSKLTRWLSYHPFTAIFYSLIIPTIYSRLTLLSPSRCIYSRARPLIGHLVTVLASDWPTHLCCDNKAMTHARLSPPSCHPRSPELIAILILHTLTHSHTITLPHFLAIDKTMSPFPLPIKLSWLIMLNVAFTTQHWSLLYSWIFTALWCHHPSAPHSLPSSPGLPTFINFRQNKNVKARDRIPMNNHHPIHHKNMTFKSNF